jgi:hypothetical protein
MIEGQSIPHFQTNQAYQGQEDGGEVTLASLDGLLALTSVGGNMNL